MRWIIAENKNNCAVMVFDLMVNSQKVKNSFDTLKTCDKVLQTINNPVYFPLLLVDSGISIEAYFKKYPLEDTIKPNTKRGINRVVPSMRIKTVKEDQTVSTEPIKQAVEKQPKQAIKPAISEQKKRIDRTSKPQPVKKVKTEPKPQPKQENKKPIKKAANSEPKPKPQPKKDIKPVKPVQAVKPKSKRFALPKIKDTRKIAALLTGFVALLCVVLVVNSCHINKPTSAKNNTNQTIAQPTPKKQFKPINKPVNAIVKIKSLQPVKPVQKIERVAPVQNSKIVIETPQDIKQVYKGDKLIYKANKTLKKADESTNPVKAARLQKRAERKLNRAAKKYAKANR